MNPFNTFLIELPDFSSTDAEAEVDALFARQKMIQKLLDGQEDAETLLDLLAQQGVSPDDYVETVLDNLVLLNV